MSDLSGWTEELFGTIDQIKLDTNSDENVSEVIFNLNRLDLQFTSEIFGRSFAHDIANPLTAININVDFLKRVLSGLEENSELVTETLDASKRLIQDIHEKINTLRYYSIGDLFQPVPLISTLQQIFEPDTMNIFADTELSTEMSLIYLYFINAFAKFQLNPEVVSGKLYIRNQGSSILRIALEFKDPTKVQSLVNSIDRRIYILENFDYFRFELEKFEKITSKYNLNYDLRQSGKFLLISIT